MGKRGKKKRVPFRAASATASSASPSPFEAHHGAKRFAVLGRHVNRTNVNKAREQSLIKRRQSLQVEYEQRTRANVIVDERPERGSDLAQQTFVQAQQERMRAHSKKKSRYQLDEEDLGGDGGGGGGGGGGDDSEDRDVLTHAGLPIDQLTAHHEFQPDYDDDEYDEQLNSALFASSFGGGGSGHDEDGPPKSKAEVMQEIIMKSKLGRYQREEQRTAQQQLATELDSQFDQLAKSQKLLANKKQLLAAAAAADTAVDGDVGQDAGAAASMSMARKRKTGEAAGDYDALLKTLAEGSDKRARPTDRLKSEAERASDLQQRLQALEEQRLGRMTSVAYDRDLDPNDGHDGDELSARGGDDLDDAWATVEVNDTVNHFDGGEGDMIGGSSGLHDDSGNFLGPDEEGGQRAPEARVNGASSSSTWPSSRVPFAVERCPSTLDEYNELARGLDAADQTLLISRIRACHSPLLQPQNKDKMEQLIVVLLARYWQLAQRAGRPAITRRARSKQVDHEGGAVNGDDLFAQLDMLAMALVQLARDHACSATVAFRRMLVEQNVLVASAGDGGASAAPRWPKLSQSLLMKLVPVVFAPTDLRHAVITPVFLCLAQRLRQCPVKSVRDVMRGLFLASIALEMAAPPRRYVPEVQAFLVGMLAAFVRDNGLERGPLDWAVVPFPDGLLLLCDEHDDEKASPPAPISVAQMCAVCASDAPSPSVSSLMACCAGLLAVQWTIVCQAVGCPELWADTQHLMEQVVSGGARSLAPMFGALAERSRRQSATVVDERSPLALYAEPPRALRQLDPALNPASGGGARRLAASSAAALADTEASAASMRDELKRLKKKRRTEMRGAVRELRKDNYFVESLRRADHAQLVQEKAGKEKAIMTMLMGQQHEANQLDSMKAKEAGKKKRANFNRA